MRIAILGTRGIPAAYGGFETLASELSHRLAERGHQVTVYCRRGRTGAGTVPPGVSRVVVPCIHSKYLETVSHTAFSTLHALIRPYDAILMCNAANAVLAWIPRLRRTGVALNVDGLEANRTKWNRLGRAHYRLSERVAPVFASRIVTDARVIQSYYRERYGVESTYIPYGAPAVRPVMLPPAADGPLARFELQPRGYVLYVSRLEPENHAHTVVSAFAQCDDLPLELVVTGQAPYAAPYIHKVLLAADSRTVFTGGVYGDGYHELQAYARCYVHATVVGGVHPALVEAMAYGNAIVCADTPENRETLGDAGVFYPPTDVDACADAIRHVCRDDTLRHELGARARERARREYSWEQVADAYERLLSELAGIDLSPAPATKDDAAVA